MAGQAGGIVAEATGRTVGVSLGTAIVAIVAARCPQTAIVR